MVKNPLVKRLYHNARFETMDADNPLATYLLCEGAHILYIGNERPSGDFETHDLNGALATPGLIDCHTHLAYGGNRADEFEMRLNGATYEEIARAGGGIKSTVNATRATDDAQLFTMAKKRLQNWLQSGFTTIEIKSGYGLDLRTERALLNTARQIARASPIDVVTSYLAAHALPLEYSDKDAYIAETNLWMKALHSEGLIDAVDAFCEGIGFSLTQTRAVFETAKALNIPVKLHAEQLSNLGGAKLAASYNALSADHLEYIDEESANAMAHAGTVAVLLPAATYFIRESKMPDIKMLRASGVKIALASDHNPGSSPITSPLLVMNMAATLFRMTPHECLKGFTVNAAAALGFKDRGILRKGMRADLAVWDIKSSNELTYWIGNNPHILSIYKGKIRDIHAA